MTKYCTLVIRIEIRSTAEKEDVHLDLLLKDIGNDARRTIQKNIDPLPDVAVGEASVTLE